MKATARIWVDFNNSDIQGRVRLITAGALSDISKQQVILTERLRITIHQDNEFNVLARVQFFQVEMIWVAKVDWSTQQTQSPPDQP